MRSFGRVALYVVVGMVVVLLIAPTLVVGIASLGDTRSLAFPPKGLSGRWYEAFFTDEWLPTAWNSLKIAVLTAALATLLGTMAAFGIVRGRFRGQSVVSAFLLAPLIVPTVIVGIGLFQVFGDWRLSGTTLGLVLAHSALALPFVVATVGASLRTVDPILERAAANLGAGPVSTLRQVTLPLILPGILTGALFAFVVSLDEIVVAIFLTSPTLTTLPVQIFATLQSFLDPTVAAISTMLLGVTALALIGSALFSRRGRMAA
jgi:putative spermidine/putrescine transport system permease protein